LYIQIKKQNVIHESTHLRRLGQVFGLLSFEMSLIYEKKQKWKCTSVLSTHILKILSLPFRICHWLYIYIYIYTAETNLLIPTQPTVSIQVEVFWVVKTHTVVVGNQRFRGPCCLHPNMETTWQKCQNPEDLDLNLHCCKNLKALINVSRLNTLYHTP